MKPTRQQLNRIHEPWPEDGLEEVKQCPVCCSEKREILYKGLRDRVFFCAPGEWTLHRCNGCGSAYLDPRPTPGMIHLAYESYFTHQPPLKVADLSPFGKLRRIFANGYRNWRYGTNERPASGLGVLIAWLMPNMRAALDVSFRYLPRPRTGQRLLDVGCGNGAFLLRAQSAGWDVMGLDFDPKAIEAAKQAGLDVCLGGMSALAQEKEQFDIVTLSHVIEHVHDPNRMLRDCFRLIKPGGYLWIETPNLNAEGHRLFGENWRGLEPPRHLVLFTRTSLCAALHEAGFNQVEDQPYRPLCESIFAASEAITEERVPWGEEQLSVNGRRAARQAERKAWKEVDIREFITVKAWKKP